MLVFFFQLTLGVINPIIRRVFILFIGLKAVRSALQVEQDWNIKLLSLSDELALMFVVPVAAQVMYMFISQKSNIIIHESGVRSRIFLFYSVLVYSVIAVYIDQLALFILFLAYFVGFIASHVLNLLTSKKIMLIQGAVYIGFAVYIILLIISSNNFLNLPLEKVFLLVILPRVALSNFFNIYWKYHLHKYRN